MHTVVRIYKNADLSNALLEHKEEIEKIIRKVRGFVSYTLFRSGGSAISVTTCRDKAGCEESSRKAKEWLSENVPLGEGLRPEIYSGEDIIHMSPTEAANRFQHSLR